MKKVAIVIWTAAAALFLLIGAAVLFSSGGDAASTSYLAALDSAVPGVRSERPDQAVLDDAENTCADIDGGVEAAVLLKRVAERFDVDQDTARQVLEVTRDHCGELR